MLNSALHSSRHGGSGGTLRRLTGNGERTIAPVLPAVTSTMQATVTTGVTPDRHGIVGNGLYFADLGKVSFWEQSNRLLDAPRVWQGRDGKTAMLFWQNSMFGAADIVLTPRPVHTPDGRTLSSCYSNPPGLYAELAEKLGPFELKFYWGPFASLPASQWITAAAVGVWQKHRPALQLVYIPHLDYPLQKAGPNDPSIAREVALVDTLIGTIADAVAADGARLIVMGDYGITPASRGVLPNVALRDAGLLQVRNMGGIDTIEIGELDAFAMVDHQIAHVYCSDDDARRRARDVLRNLDGVAEVLDLTEADPFHLRHRRSGQLVALAEPGAWFAYYWWKDPAAAPPFARTVDIHRKPGYDPCELFIDPAAKAISMDPSRVKGTHGLLPADAGDRPVLLSSAELHTEKSVVPATEVAKML
ncbi:MAG: alkaline phosphatase family protein [Phycisphaerae bacterium]|nr:alkaline phosphatase family protein [Phycisphaerae bacterium]